MEEKWECHSSPRHVPQQSGHTCMCQLGLNCTDSKQNIKISGRTVTNIFKVVDETHISLCNIFSILIVFQLCLCLHVCLYYCSRLLTREKQNCCFHLYQIWHACCVWREDEFLSRLGQAKFSPSWLINHSKWTPSLSHGSWRAPHTHILHDCSNIP